MFVQTGCLSAKIASRGQRYDYLLRPGTRIEHVTRSLGEPIRIEVYDPPIRFKETPEIYRRTAMQIKLQALYRTNQREHELYGSNSIIPGFLHQSSHPEHNPLISTMAVYRRTGPYANIKRGRAYAAMTLLTFGLSEPFTIRDAMRMQKNMADKEYEVVFWFDEHGRFAGVFPDRMVTPAMRQLDTMEAPAIRPQPLPPPPRPPCGGDSRETQSPALQ